MISLLYIGTFGSFIGFAFAFGQVLQINFAAGGQNAAQASLHAAQIAFIGPLLGSLSRVYGGKLADRIGGGRVTLWVFGGMIIGAGILVGVSTLDDHTSGPATAMMMGGYVVGFIVLFLLSGIGNGSVYKMIPSIFEARSRSLDVSEAERVALVTRDVRRTDRLRRRGRSTRRRWHQPGAAAVVSDEPLGDLGVLDLPVVLRACLRGDLGHVRAASVVGPVAAPQQVDLART